MHGRFNRAGSSPVACPMQVSLFQVCRDRVAHLCTEWGSNHLWFVHYAELSSNIFEKWWFPTWVLVHFPAESANFESQELVRVFGPLLLSLRIPFCSDIGLLGAVRLLRRLKLQRAGENSGNWQHLHLQIWILWSRLSVQRCAYEIRLELTGTMWCRGNGRASGYGDCFCNRTELPDKSSECKFRRFWAAIYDYNFFWSVSGHNY